MLLCWYLIFRCMGHNRGWEEAASTLSGASIQLKTCNAALLQAVGKSWDEVLTVFMFLLWENYIKATIFWPFCG